VLVHARQLAQMPARRLRRPETKTRQQRTLAAGFYAGAALIVGGPIGLWTRWLLYGRDPWAWAARYVLQGRRPWSRPLLLGYWALLGLLSVAGWSRQLARSRRYRPRPGATPDPSASPFIGVSAAAAAGEAPPSTDASGANSPVQRDSGMGEWGFASLPALPNGEGVSRAATGLLDAAHQHVPTLSLNARRKFFHALAVAMFLPGLAFDVRFLYSRYVLYSRVQLTKTDS
jgi:dolichol kinase